MNPIDFLRTIYLGDRWIKKILIDNETKSISFQIDCISRIRSKSGNWEFYNDENIDNGLIVFEKVSYYDLGKTGNFPNDEIHSIEVKEKSPNLFEFFIEANYINSDAISQTIETTIIAESVYLSDSNGCKRITN